jgi:hypothetical protein
MDKGITGGVAGVWQALNGVTVRSGRVLERLRRSS